MSKFKLEKNVVVTGCYQIFHRGHLNLLKTAANYGYVTVLLNSDDGVLTLKGYLAKSYDLRKKDLLATGLVQKVIKFYVDPSKILKNLRPDFLLAGSDHTKEEILSNGGIHAGKIIIVPYTPGISSTDLFKESR